MSCCENRLNGVVSIEVDCDKACHLYGTWRMLRVVSKTFALIIEQALMICDTSQVVVHFHFHKQFCHCGVIFGSWPSDCTWTTQATSTGRPGVIKYAAIWLCT